MIAILIFIYAYEALKQELGSIERLDFLFGEPRFIQSLTVEVNKKAFKIEDCGIKLSSRLQQSKLARECEQWITDKVNIRSILNAKEDSRLSGEMNFANN